MLASWAGQHPLEAPDQDPTTQRAGACRCRPDSNRLIEYPPRPYGLVPTVERS